MPVRCASVNGLWGSGTGLGPASVAGRIASSLSEAALKSIEHAGWYTPFPSSANTVTFSLPGVMMSTEPSDRLLEAPGAQDRFVERGAIWPFRRLCPKAKNLSWQKGFQCWRFDGKNSAINKRLTF